MIQILGCIYIHILVTLIPISSHVLDVVTHVLVEKSSFAGDILTPFGSNLSQIPMLDDLYEIPMVHGEVPLVDG
jgi:hypothetical protein